MKKSLAFLAGLVVGALAMLLVLMLFCPGDGDPVPAALPGDPLPKVEAPAVKPVAPKVEEAKPAAVEPVEAIEAKVKE